MSKRRSIATTLKQVQAPAQHQQVKPEHGALALGSMDMKENKMADLNYAKIPVDYMVDGVRRYIERGPPPGHFLTALICNDLRETVARADLQNQLALISWVKWFYNEAPGGCWGSVERMKDWMAHGGLEGMKREDNDG